jgi:lauroyl/myristoyl acyltransferase
MKYLSQKGRVVIACDMFNSLNNCPVDFFGKHHNVSLLPARLARIAGVPLITAVPVLRNGIIKIDEGPQFDLNSLKADSGDVMQKIVLFLETEIKNNPGVWHAAYYKHFLN